MPDVTGVTDPQKPPRGPSLDDIADVVARTNRGLLALSEQVFQVQMMVIMGMTFIATLILAQKVIR